MISDNQNTCIVLYIEINKEYVDQLDTYANHDEDSISSVGDKRKKGGKDLYNPKQKKNQLLDIFEVQSFDFNQYLSSSANSIIKNVLKVVIQY